MAATYPVRLREWVRPGERIVCPECKGLRWVPVCIWEPRLQDLAAVTINCTWCHGRGWLYQSEDDEEGRGYDSVIG